MILFIYEVVIFFEEKGKKFITMERENIFAPIKTITFKN